MPHWALLLDYSLARQVVWRLHTLRSMLLLKDKLQFHLVDRGLPLQWPMQFVPAGLLFARY